MYFESKDKGGIERKSKEDVQFDKKNQELRLKEFHERFMRLKSEKTKGGNN
ncbi:MAG: hypothetical protein K5988_03830 [Lachnospiraceae bacterium]|nr:hypothetical protein [Lachnospiraceae bacterium]